MPIRIRNINIHQFDNGITLSGERAVLEIGSSLAYGAKGAEVIGLCDFILLIVLPLACKVSYCSGWSCVYGSDDQLEPIVPY